MKISQASLLVVDDNEMNRDMLSRRLERKGYVVTVVEDGKRALETIEQHKVDLVLLDIEMPGISGLEVLRILRESYSPIQLPVIMVTAKNQSDNIVEALGLGANDYVTKPVDFPVALARVRTQLSHKRSEEALRESEERYMLAARGANDGLWDWNLKTGEIYFSTRWKSMLGCEEADIGNIPEEWFRRVHPEDLEQVKSQIGAHLEGVTPHYENQYRMLHRDGTYRWILSRGLAVRGADGKAYRIAGSQTDITDSKVVDALTGLPNRVLFMDRLGCMVERAKRHKNYLFAVLFLDLDRFKLINDSLGHPVGDQLLVALARRLETSLRSGDTVAHLGEGHTLGRLGGDEFIILLDDIKHASDATRVAERIGKELMSPFNITGQEVFTTASIGIALSTTGYERPEALLQDADTALNRAKMLGKARYEIFDAEMRASTVARLQLEAELRRAIERQEFQNYYQPIISLDTGRIKGFEALVRWEHPTRGLVSPAEFIPIAEETGLIFHLGQQVLREACRQMHTWQAHFPDSPPLTISVNISRRQFTQPDLIDQVIQILRETSLPASCLELEITEGMVMADPASTVSQLSQLKALGVKLSIDDFGTGYSSLSCLHRFPLDTLKIDRAFICRMSVDEESRGIVQTILTLAHNLGLDVTAEGVETVEQLDLLRNLRCEHGQGYYFSRPVDRESAGNLVAALPCTVRN
jgi:diguanylate cyclase (GGDEF)-like protein/PAS domain S-box-containing protein